MGLFTQLFLYVIIVRVNGGFFYIPFNIPSCYYYHKYDHRIIPLYTLAGGSPWTPCESHGPLKGTDKYRDEERP